MQPMTAQNTYGGIGGNILPIGGSKAMGAGSPVPSPDQSAAPSAAIGVAAGDLFDDPTFWLVALAGAVIALASASS